MKLVEQKILVSECVDVGDIKINIYRALIEDSTRFFLLAIALTYLKRFIQFKPDYYT